MQRRVLFIQKTRHQTVSINLIKIILYTDILAVNKLVLMSFFVETSQLASYSY